MKNKKRSFLRRLLRGMLIGICILIVSLIVAAILIAEPWKSDQIEHTIPPQVTDMGLIKLNIDQEYIFDIPLDANEIISSIDSQYPSVMEPIGYGIRANGATLEVPVTVTTRQAVMSGRDRRIVFLGQDYSEPYYNLRLYLRTLFNIENTYTLPSELRVLHIYKYRFLVPEYPIEQAGHIHIPQGKYTDIAPQGLGDETYSLVKITDPAIVSAHQLVSDNDYRLTGVSAGNTEAYVIYGFYVSNPQAHATKPNLFVPVFARRYTVSVTQ